MCCHGAGVEKHEDTEPGRERQPLGKVDADKSRQIWDKERVPSSSPFMLIDVDPAVYGDDKTNHQTLEEGCVQLHTTESKASTTAITS
ncbi:hypothetical protein G7K_3701-t1 [Saitoella complicata NRRL Y-17804]|uniref:Uncharacterized protein n=1 Tax=Saitoella complicata (strain BCRC 22490 / CBS 7301 / JCM 7358 / NBRC 10748 / NRRL Y-17804) TaxID=698492 RepID=A0A0E9NI55_SAICN|nr:hypothetical protein G7K_3701-t1 [Saitoella complicata NRRL Y-17804]